MPMLASMPRLAVAALALALLAALPSAAAAQGTVPSPDLAVVEPAADAKLPRNAHVTVRVRPASPVQSLRIRVAPGDEVDASGLLTQASGLVDVDATFDGTDWTAQVPAVQNWAARPGSYWYQPIATALSAEGAQTTLVGAVRRLTIVQDPANTVRNRMYNRFGRRGNAAFVISMAGRPQGVTKARWKQVVTQSARRWGLRVLGTTTRRVKRGDGRNTVGFSSRVPARALAFQRDLYYGPFVSEQDIEVRNDILWQQGPAYPLIDEYDLESVLVHELGHMAGNKPHRPRCANHAMAESLGSGEWWRGPRDLWRFDCAASAAAAGGLPGFSSTARLGL
jgi:hypothetical protein